MSEITTSRDGAVAVIALDRPAKRNAITFPMQIELRAALEKLEGDPGLRALILTGNGGDFCVGGDFALSRRIADEPGFGKEVAVEHDATIGVLFALEAPVIAAIEGAALGFGAELAACCDHVVMAENACIADPHVPLGLPPAPAVAMLWPRLIDRALAADLIHSGRRVAADEALAIGLASRVVPAGTALAAAMAQAHAIAALPAGDPAARRRAPRPSRAELERYYQAGVAVEAPGARG